MSGSVSSSSPSYTPLSNREEDDDEDDNFSIEGAGAYKEEEDVVVEKGDLQKYCKNDANFRDVSLKLPFMYGIAASF